MPYSIYFKTPTGEVVAVDDCDSRKEAEEIVKASKPLLKSLGIEDALQIKETSANDQGGETGAKNQRSGRNNN